MLMPRLILASMAFTTIVALERMPQANDAAHVRAVPDVKEQATTLATIKPSGEVRVENVVSTSEMPRKSRAVKKGDASGNAKTSYVLRADTDTGNMDSGYDNAVEIQESGSSPIVGASATAKPEPLSWKDGLVAGVLAHFQVQDGITRVIVNVCLVVWSIMLVVWFCAWKIAGSMPSEIPENSKPSFSKLPSTGFVEGEDELDAMLRKVREAKRIGKVPDLDGAPKNLSDKLRGQRSMLFDKIWADAKKEPTESAEEADTTHSDAPQDQPPASKAPTEMEKMFQQMDARLKAENEELREKIQVTN